MRARTEAAVLLLAVSVVAESKLGPLRRVSVTETIHTSYIVLHVPVDGAEMAVVPFRIELVKADEACSPAKLSIDDRHLEQDAKGFGQGAMTLDNGVDITSNWTFTCHSLKQALAVNIHSVNGRPAVGSSFTVDFYHVTPVQIAITENVAKVPCVHQHTTVTESPAYSGEEHASTEDSYQGSDQNAQVLGGGERSVDDEVSQLMDLREQARELVALIRDQESVIMDKLGHNRQAKLASDPTPTIIAGCLDIRCAFKVLAYEFQYSHEEVCESSSGWHTLFGYASRGNKMDRDRECDDSKYDTEMKGLYWEDEAYFFPNHKDVIDGVHNKATQAYMLMLVAMTAFISSIAVFYITAFIRQLTRGRRNQPRTSNELSLRQAGSHYLNETVTSLHSADEDKSRAPFDPSCPEQMLHHHLLC